MVNRREELVAKLQDSGWTEYNNTSVVNICKHSIFRLDTQYSQTYLCAVTFKNNDYGKRKSKLSGGI